ncbi:PSF3 protein, partial [Eolophus roseicapillus]|nr:PSF3 protein [Eolophus roseicapilla]
MSEAYFPVGPGLGLEESFLSLDDILMSQEKLPGRAETSLPRLGFALGQGTGTGDAITEVTARQGYYYHSQQTPRGRAGANGGGQAQGALGAEAWRTVLSADASVVDLHKMGPYYYGFGSQLLNFDNPENPEIAQAILQATSVLPVSNSAYLLQTFISRFRRIMDSSQNAYNEDTSALVARLDELERALFQAGQKGLNDFQSWEKGQTSQITASSLVQNYGKRKFTEVDG